MDKTSVTIYHNPRCSKSRATLQLLEDNNIQPNIIEYMKEPPDRETLENIVTMLGLPVRELLRSHEQVFKDAGMDDAELTDDEIYEAITQCPTLLQRPIVVVDEKKAALGRPPENVLEII
jgi:arsenate reductase (glutaredoxin)